MTQSLQQLNNKNKLHFQDSWESVKNDLILHYGEAIFRSWFSKMCILDCSENYITLSVPTNFMRDWIKANYFDSIQRLWSYYDNSIKYIDIVTIAEPSNNDTIENVLPPDNSNSTTIPLSFAPDNSGFIFSSALDPRLTFNNFVVGRPNELAYAAARAVAESNTVLGETNPLFLYGGVGLGKTHLMHAIAWHIQACNSQRKVIYMSAEKFMYQFVQSLRNKDVMSFKEQFRSVDILMIDDIQFICGKESTQEEFFHTFNTLIDNKRQIVISCDRSPSALDNVEERIKSRLGWGLVADVHSTTYELRLGILQSKIEQLNVYVPLNVLEFLANKITSNVRELEGALNKVVAHSTLVGLEITLENTQDILRDLLRSSQKNITIETIQKKVARRYNVEIADMLSQRKSRDVARPRQLAMYLAKRLTSHSLVDIGKTFNKKDHTTVIHAIKTVEELIKSDVNFNNEINSLMQMLQV